MNLLHTLGLMTRKEHESVEQDRDDWSSKSGEQSVEISELTAKFKQAITDLAAARDEVEDLERTVSRKAALIECRDAEIADLRPIAEKAIAKAARDAAAKREKRAMDRDRRKGKA